MTPTLFLLGFLAAGPLAEANSVDSATSGNPCAGDEDRFVAEWQDLLHEADITFYSTGALPWLPPDSRWSLLIGGVLLHSSGEVQAGAFGGSCNPATGHYERQPPGQPTGIASELNPNTCVP